jgi:hypothetical protein
MSGAADAARQSKIITCVDCGKNFEAAVMLNIHKKLDHGHGF